MGRGRQILRPIFCVHASRTTPVAARRRSPVVPTGLSPQGRTPNHPSTSTALLRSHPGWYLQPPPQPRVGVVRLSQPAQSPPGRTANSPSASTASRPAFLRSHPGRHVRTTPVATRRRSPVVPTGQSPQERTADFPSASAAPPNPEASFNNPGQASARSLRTLHRVQPLPENAVP